MFIINAVTKHNIDVRLTCFAYFCYVLLAIRFAIGATVNPTLQDAHTFTSDSLGRADKNSKVTYDNSTFNC